MDIEGHFESLGFVDKITYTGLLQLFVTELTAIQNKSDNEIDEYIINKILSITDNINILGNKSTTMCFWEAVQTVYPSRFDSLSKMEIFL